MEIPEKILRLENVRVHFKPEEDLASSAPCCSSSPALCWLTTLAEGMPSLLKWQLGGS